MECCQVCETFSESCLVLVWHICNVKLDDGESQRNNMMNGVALTLWLCSLSSMTGFYWGKPLSVQRLGCDWWKS